MKNKKPTIIITGADGFIGRHLVEHFCNKKWRVIAFVRRPDAFAVPGVRAVRFALDDVPAQKAFEGADYLIHAAYAKANRINPDAFQKNVQGSKELTDRAAAAGVKKTLFISSQSARIDAKSSYGRQKHKIEGMFSGPGAAVIRPGLVVGNGGLTRQIVQHIRTKRVLPLIDGGKQPLQVVAVYDLVTAVDIITEKGYSGIFTVATPDSISYKTFYQTVAAHFGRRPWLVSVPFILPLLVIRGINLLRLPLSVTEDNLRGLQQMRKVETAKDLKKLELTLDTLPQILTKINWQTLGGEPKINKSSSQTLRYLTTGGLAFVVEYAVFATLLAATNHLIFANSLSFVIGVITGFLLHKFWSFAGSQRLKTKYQLITFGGLSVFNLIMANVLISFFVESFEFWAYLAKPMVIVIIAIWNFIFYKAFIFRHLRASS